MGRRVYVELAGDSAKLDRAFANSSGRARQWGESVSQSFAMGAASAARANTVFSSIGPGALVSGFAGGAGFMAASMVGNTLVRGLREGVSGAIKLESSSKAIEENFGGAAEQVKRFAEGGASNLGISAVQSEQIATRVGLLGSNLHIAAPKAAEMAINLQKLAGSIAMIRGSRPDAYLSKLPLVLAGNTRALKEMGLAITQTEIKDRAMQMGLIKEHMALSSRAKALAIYSLVTERLGDLQAEAALHSDTLAAKDARLAAKTANLKDRFGALVTGPLGDFVTLLEAATGKTNDLNVAMEKTGGQSQDWTQRFRARTMKIVKAAFSFSPGFFGLHQAANQLGPGGPSDQQRIFIQGKLMADKYAKGVKSGIQPDEFTMIGWGGDKPGEGFNAYAAGLAAATAYAKGVKAGIPPDMFTILNPPGMDLPGSGYPKHGGKGGTGSVAVAELPRSLQLKAMKAQLSDDVQLQLQVARQEESFFARQEKIANKGSKKYKEILQQEVAAHQMVTGLEAQIQNDQDQRDAAAKSAREKAQQQAQARHDAAIQRKLDTAQLAVDAADLTGNLFTEIRALQNQERVLKGLIAQNRKNTDLQSQLLSTQKKLQDLRQQTVESARSAFGELFRGPVIAPSEEQRKRILGVPGVTADKMLADLQAQNADYSKWMGALAKIRKRGAPAGLVDELQAMGTAGLDQALSIAGASGGTFQGIAKAYRTRQSLASKMATVTMRAQVAHVHAAKVTLSSGVGHAGREGVGARNVTININGAQNPREVAREVEAILQKRARSASAQRRGRGAGSKVGLS